MAVPRGDLQVELISLFYFQVANYILVESANHYIYKCLDRTQFLQSFRMFSGSFKSMLLLVWLLMERYHISITDEDYIYFVKISFYLHLFPFFLVQGTS